MSIFGIIITYACSWWVVLFMVLPWKVKMAANPPIGPAASAPVNPMLRKKFIITSVLAIVPTAFLHFYIGEARADEIYHAGGGCKRGAEYRSSGDIEARDGYASGGKKVAPATMGTTGNVAVPPDVYVGINAPIEDYVSDDNANLRRSDIYAGVARVKMDGGVEYNGQPISQQPLDGEDCK